MTILSIAFITCFILLIESKHHHVVKRTKPQLSIDFGTHSTSFNHHNDTTIPQNDRKMNIQISLDPSSIIRLGSHLLQATSHTFTATLGILRLLAPLIVSRQALNTLVDFFADYMRGRYFRKTYTRLERLYIRYYEAPAVLRAIARTVSQIAVLHFLAGVMAYLVGISHSPCHSEVNLFIYFERYTDIFYFRGGVWRFFVVLCGCLVFLE